MKYLIQSIIIFVVLISFSSCDKEDNSCDIRMTFADHSALAGCGYLLVLDLDDEERRLDPINLDSFDIVPSNGLKVCGTFIEIADAANTCQVGEIVQLTSLELR